MRMRAGGTALLVAALAAGGCSADDDPVCNETSVGMALQGGVALDWTGSRATVFLGDCSGVLLSRHVIATAAHCLPTERVLEEVLPAAYARLAVRGGGRAERCLTGSRGADCAEADFAVAVQPGSDVALLVSAAALADADSVAMVATSGETSALRVQGYGIGSPAATPGPASACPSVQARLAAPDPASAGQQNFSAILHASQWGAASIYGHAPDHTGVCAGDSGGPAFAADDMATAVAVGILASSTPDAARPYCTAPGGLQRWERLDPAFLRGALDGCVDATTPAGRAVLDCSASQALSAPELATPAIGQPPADTAVALDPATDPGLPAMLFRPGVTIHAGPPTSAANRLHAMSAPAGMRVVGAATSRGHYTILIDEAKAGPLLSGGMDGGSGGDRTAMTARNLSLSGGVDNRQANFVVQAGGVRSTSASTGSPGCTGALVGSRLARTAAHCVNFSGANYFTARYDGGVTTWTFDGGATFVTFRPVAADGYFYGGNYFNFNCNNNAIRFATTASQEACAPQDWAILILPTNAWSTIHVVPSYMGYTSPSLRTVSNTGYPSCFDISSPSIPTCTAGRMYGNVNCSIAVNHTSFYYTTCDESPGQSGGPTYFDSGGRLLVGHHIAGPFGGVACSGSTCPSEDCGTDSWFFGFMNDLRTQYSAVQL